MIGMECPQLQVLTSNELHFSHMQQLIRGCRKLKVLRVTTTNLSDTLFDALSKYALDLEDLYFGTKCKSIALRD